MHKQRTLALKGFTLIELLIVITIIGILIVGLVPRIVGAPAKARDVARLGDLSQVATSLESYFSDKGRYPQVVSGAETSGCLSGLTTAMTGYITALPKDPVPGNNFPEAILDMPAAACLSGYIYQPLSSATVASPGTPIAPHGVGFILVANTELENNGNAINTGLTSALNTVLQRPVAADTGTYYFLAK